MSLRAQFTAALKTTMQAGDTAGTSTLRMIMAKVIQGKRQDLVDKETAEIALIESFLPTQMDEATLSAEIDAAVAETGATTVKDMGKVMAILKQKHAATLDMARAGALVKSRLG